MAPNVADVAHYRSGVLFETEEIPDYIEVIQKEKEAQKKKKVEQPIYWSNVYWFSVMHLMALYGGCLVFSSAKLLTTAWGKWAWETPRLCLMTHDS